MRTLIKNALKSSIESAKHDITIKGWVRTRRDNKDFSFIELNDGTSLANMQCIVDAGTPGYTDIQKMSTGAAIGITGKNFYVPFHIFVHEQISTELCSA